MLTLYDQEQATQMMLANERRTSLRTGRAEGLKAGRREGEIKNTVELCQEFNKSMDDVVAMLMKKFGLSIVESNTVVNRYWKS